MTQPTLAYITEDEIAVLLALRDLVGGYGPSFRIERVSLQASPTIDDADLLRHLSYLAQHGLIGTNETSTPQVIKFTNKSGPVERRIGTTPAFNSAYLTGAGIDFIRALEAIPGMPQRITAATLKTAGAAIVAAGRIVLTEWAKATVGGYGHHG